MARVDVIVPCYNYGHFLEGCVESALRQDGVDVRVLIIDDASPDDTEVVGRRLAERDPRVTYRRHAVNQGHIATYNEGLLEWADGDYALLLSADDMLTPGALARAARLMDAHPEVGMTYGDVIRTAAPDFAAVPVLPQYEVEVTPGPAFIEASCRALRHAGRNRDGGRSDVGSARGRRIPEGTAARGRPGDVAAVRQRVGDRAGQGPAGVLPATRREHVERILRRSRPPGLRPDPGRVRILLRRVRCPGGRPGRGSKVWFTGNWRSRRSTWRTRRSTPATGSSARSCWRKPWPSGPESGATAGGGGSSSSGPSAVGSGRTSVVLRRAGHVPATARRLRPPNFPNGRTPMNVSIAIPTYNRAAEVEKTLATLARLDHDRVPRVRGAGHRQQQHRRDAGGGRADGSRCSAAGCGACGRSGRD